MENKKNFGLLLVLMMVLVSNVLSKANPNLLEERINTINSDSVDSQLATLVLETAVPNYFVLNSGGNDGQWSVNIPKNGRQDSKVVIFNSPYGFAYSQGNCNHLTNPTAKRHCLQRQLDEANRQQRLAQERLNRANLRMQQACAAVGALDQAANIASRQGANVNVRAAGVTWRSVRAIMSALTQEKRNCESARQEVERARRGQ